MLIEPNWWKKVGGSKSGESNIGEVEFDEAYTGRAELWETIAGKWIGKRDARQ